MKKDLRAVFQDFLTTENLVGKKLLFMVSGGVDSMVLLNIARSVIKKDLIAVLHLNHNSRDNAHEDEKFVQNICSKYKVRYYTNKLEIIPSKNIESQWRKARRAAANEVGQAFGALRILTAHHATDLVETMIFRLSKGAGPNGLSPFETGTKPFWNIPKSDLIDYAHANSIDWREDASNLNTKFERNLIRAEVLPVLRKITPNLEPVFVRESNTFEEISDFIKTELQKQCGEALVVKQLSLKQFLALHAALKTELLRTIAVKTPSQSELDDCLKWLLNKPQGNSKKTLGGTTLTLQQQQIRW